MHRVSLIENFVSIFLSDKIYFGHKNSLVMKTKVYAEYGCVFNLRNFPFDTQNCSMNFTVDSAKARYIQLVPRNITFQVTQYIFSIISESIIQIEMLMYI